MKTPTLRTSVGNIRGKSDVPLQYQEEYTRELQKANFQSVRIITLLGVTLVPASTILDYFIYPEHLSLFAVIRSFMTACCLILFFLTYVKKLRPISSVITMSAMFAVGGGIAYMIRILGYDDPYYAGLNLIYLASMLVPWGIRKTLIACSVVFGFYMIPILIYDLGTLDVPLFVNNSVFQLETIIIAAVVNHVQSIGRKNEIVGRLTVAHQAKELEEIDRYKREFIANITHELKTPLAMVMGNADLIMEQLDNTKIREDMNLIRKATYQLANHVDRIIAVANVDDPDAKPDLGNYDYCGVVQNIFSQFEFRAREENITFALNPVPGPLVVNIDIVQIEEVLNNLIQNAFKFTPTHGIITITVSTDGERIFTEVSDSGVGIPEEKMGRIFDRMYQADEVLSKRHSGIGLGLYISRKNIEIHGGQISVHSIQGKGTSFKFSLPLHIDQSAKVKNLPYTGEERRKKSRSKNDRRSGTDRRMAERRKNFEYQQRMGLDELAQMTFSENVRDFENLDPSKPSILVLEDNAGMMKVIVEALHKEYNLLLAFDAFEALRKLESHHIGISLVLSDIMLPGMSGFDFCKKMMKKEEHRQIPLIFISALMSQEDQLRGFSLGATDYIVKPYSIKILKEKVDNWIARRQYELLLKDVSSSLEEKVKQSSKVKDIILHEIGNPLQMITGANYFIDRLRDSSYDKSTDEEKSLWHSIQALQQGTDALRSVLESTRHLDVDNFSTRQTEKLRDVLNDAREQTQHLLGDIQLDIQHMGNDDLSILCDRRMVVQVLVNLIRNGAEAIRERSSAALGRIELKTERVNGHINIHVSDNGIGMDSEMVGQLFRFKFTTKKDGTGIGLHLAKMIIKLHEGNIAVSSKKHQGTTFKIQLPLMSAMQSMENVFDGGSPSKDFQNFQN